VKQESPVRETRGSHASGVRQVTGNGSSDPISTLGDVPSGLVEASSGADGSPTAASSLEAVELFAGAGGLALGLKRAGFRPKLLVDFDERSCATLRANQARLAPDAEIRSADVRELDYAQYYGVDLFSAGAPCQPFSQGGRLRGEDDDRNMFPEAIRAIRETHPRAFILENVRGLLFPRVRPYLEYLLAELRVPSRSMRSREDWLSHRKALEAISPESHEYHVYWRLLNAADFGLSQSRPRLVIVGIRIGEPDWSWPSQTHSRDALVRELHNERYWDTHEVPARVRRAIRRTLPPSADQIGYGVGSRWRTLRDLLAKLGPPSRSLATASDPAHVYVPGARLYAKHTGSSLDWPAKTVKAGVNGSPGGEHIVIRDSGYVRYLTVRECAALQGFPKRYRLPTTRGRAMKQLGNAVPVPLAEAVGRRLAEVLRGKD
jgi:DNA (cytosine-5)-methyltransferase 1